MSRRVPAFTLTVIAAIAAVVAGTVYFGRSIRTAVISTQFGVTGSPAPEETVFAAPEEVIWEGTVLGVLAGGQGLAVRREDSGELFQAYFSADASASVTEGRVRITGRLTEISCAYAETVFAGRCVPSVDITSVQSLP